jgi:hypothetical protein
MKYYKLKKNIDIPNRNEGWYFLKISDCDDPMDEDRKGLCWNGVVFSPRDGGYIGVVYPFRWEETTEDEFISGSIRCVEKSRELDHDEILQAKSEAVASGDNKSTEG